ncbi:type I-C CRISPR-associated protein Cas7/Csd2 [Paenibacillus sp. BIHB 4019]|uniref:Type I-C CRISPR-associated protein Cas7/Csd2 n=1 Tax=Paenibacillus sp. BIHB 4019 TaxID=1870819 RepID=A0A1B2DR34_9BACL|nr:MULTISPECIES: type I-C CRISPR-associated protein Cas7/Csd2 [unclassified Paenibacillus]ANY70166.1 type I-C CRISPR-associated protein Cas7/Csd2 [Paenibacillus sp. BIHB 4019]KQN97861.1 type I-C CRISPR-associated protein Cas7/Csd2 [Paenibacillus sp. Leaf72]
MAIEQAELEKVGQNSALAQRYDFSIFFDVTNGNPNGDPDAGNMPRTDPETGHGIVTDVCIKRKVRNYIELTREGEEGFNIYVTEGAVLNEQQRRAYRAIRPDDADTKELKPKSQEQSRQLTRWMCDNFFDIRTFGAVMTTKVNCGQVRGPIQFTFARSIDPIFPQELTITRQAVTQEGAAKEREMGRKHIVPYGLYRMDGYISGYLAEKTGFTNNDLELLWEALLHMFEHDRSASRGQMTVRKLVAFQHETRLGNAPAHQLLERVDAIRVRDQSLPVEPIRSFKEYEITINRDDLPEGIKILEW